MAITYLKKSPKTSSTDDTKTTGIVQDLLKDIEKTKEQGCIDLTKKFDKYDGEIVVSKERIEEIKKNLDQKTKDDIQFSYERVRKFAEAQLKNYGQDFEVELSNGLYAGQKLVPVNTAGCYIPGGRYAHIASAVMSVTTAKVAGVKNIIACSPPKEGVGAHPTIVYTADLCGADVILNLGGVPAIAAFICDVLASNSACSPFAAALARRVLKRTVAVASASGVPGVNPAILDAANLAFVSIFAGAKPTRNASP